MNAERLHCLYDDAVDETAALALAGVLTALADPVRIRLVSLIATSDDQEICSRDLPAMLDRPQPTVSYHLNKLLRAGIVDREQRGKLTWFRLTDRLLEVRSALGEGQAG